MAGVEPFKALHYDLGKVGSLGDVAAPPYDVIDDAMRAELASRLSSQRRRARPAARSRRRRSLRARGRSCSTTWKGEGALIDDDEPAIWALTQDYTAPDGRTMTRRGFLARVKLAEYGEGVRPHERTQPGPKEDRLRLTRATKHNMSPIFSLHPGDAWPHIEPALDGDPWGETTDADGTIHRVWRVGDPAVHEAIASELADGELLIADGHHRYETAMAYAREIGGEGRRTTTS